MTLEKVAHVQLLAEFASSLLGHGGLRVWVEAADFSVRALKGQIFYFGFPYQNKQTNTLPPTTKTNQNKNDIEDKEPNNPTSRSRHAQCPHRVIYLFIF